MIKKNSVVSLSYCLKNSDGVELDRADKNQPFAYLHGVGQMVPGLENEDTSLLRKTGITFAVANLLNVDF